jgi:hypothetical protein
LSLNHVTQVCDLSLRANIPDHTFHNANVAVFDAKIGHQSNNRHESLRYGIIKVDRVSVKAEIRIRLNWESKCDFRQNLSHIFWLAGQEDVHIKMKTYAFDVREIPRYTISVKIASLI